MQMKTADLTGPALNWAVAKSNQAAGLVQSDPIVEYMSYFTPATNWSQGGPIIEREGIDTIHERNIDGDVVQIWAVLDSEQVPEYFGPTPLIAAMRCYVASRLGDEVEVPNELIGETK